MKFRLLLGSVLLAWLNFYSAANAQTKSSGPSIDDLIDWADPLALTQQKLISFLDANSKDRRKPSYTIVTDESESRVTFYPGNSAQGSMLEDTMFGGLFEVTHVAVSCYRTSSSFDITLNNKNVTKKKLAALEILLAQKTGDSHPKEVPVGSSGQTALWWVNPKYRVGITSNGYYLNFSISGVPPTSQPSQRQAASEPDKQQTLSANLDALLNFAGLWLWTPADLEKNYTLKIEDQEKQQKPPQFEWVSASKDRARFSRHMFSNAETNLTMFGGSIKVEEAILEFVNGKAARATISFFNRGDSGDITTAEFDRIFKLIGQNLGQVMKVAPKRQILSSNAALPVTGWNWTAPVGIALLEYNDYNTPGKATKPEFLRLKLAAPNQADWSMGKMATGVQRMELLQRIKKTAEGDVYISGVPMVDQGQKGYCVAASCQRLFEYMRIPCDQHEMAKLVSIDAEGGADIITMQKSLAKIDGAFNVTFKPLINPEQYYTNGRKRRVSEKAFFSIVKEYADKGVPLLWGLFLGQKPEEPPLPGGGQVSGGHMRMIIGYNLAKNQILFTDSWGAGHELKRMAMLDAYDVTLGLYSMAPRGF
ncbi:MAG: C39 family peptidase [Prosthecobacter sp.]|uniref:C39 family peptidase n=1 Tax=Prosthecobacter sp. TaxID=1965333 RepID=UPI0025E2C56C|nr:C39 family peptidase [Prosthecobacter sp.]MCF7786962.1 C39 family peptidase [Prosthecobacter sp.]